LFVCIEKKIKKKFVVPKINLKPCPEKGHLFFGGLRNNNKKRLESWICWSQGEN
jgi:hypothetical protein